MSGAAFEVESWVWIVDPDECFLPAKVKRSFRAGEDSGMVQTEDGEEHALTAAQSQQVEVCNPEVLNPVSNLIALNDLSEQSILHALRIRYKEDIIYTYISSILVSVNPYKMLPLYTPEMLDQYRQGTRGKEPHVFATAANAYQNMLSDDANQSVIISGESGAGKSEATKLILQFLADVSSRASSMDAGSALEQQVLGANPIMEAFGNAKTIRNNNSSRFGKLITVHFDRNGAITGGSIINYLLEKSRVVHQNQGERNYHIFYQLVAGGEADANLRNTLHLDDNSMFYFTNQSGVIGIEGLSDEKEFEDMRAAMETLHFSPDEVMDVMRTTSGVLHMGNINFEVDVRATEEDGSKIENLDQLGVAAELWGLDEPLIQKALTSRNIGTRSVILVSYNVDQAKDARDAMCKRVYANMFQWIITKINDVLSVESAMANSKAYIGVLDIFGFESFATNSFEQLCINYCNEKLQFHFNEHIFRLEQEVYAAEGVSVPATAFKDNQPTLDLIEQRGDGVFAMIDEEINVPRGSDEGFLSKVLQKHNGHDSFASPRPKDCENHTECFGINHYAGKVFYNVANFLEKNKDTLHDDIVQVLRQSSVGFISAMFPAEAPASRVRGPRAKKASKLTLGAQFKQQLANLMETLNSTFPHFVRCMKPNDDKLADKFVATRMLDQLRYAGLLEVCRIRKLGYPVRRDFDDFYKRFRCIVPGTPDLDSLLGGLAEKGLLMDEEWARGNTKIFMRMGQASDLELAREDAFMAEARRVQRFVRGFICRCRYAQYKNILDNLRNAIEAREEEPLADWLDMSAELPHRGVHVQLVIDGKKLQQRLAEERRVNKLLEDAIESRDISALRSAVSTADGMAPPLQSDWVQQARDMVERIEAEMALKAELKQAINARDKAQLETLLQRADEMDMDCDEVRQAAALKARIEEEELALRNLVDAMEARDLNALNGYLSKCQELGLKNAEVDQGRELQKQLQAELHAKNGLSAACEQRDLDAVVAALDKARSVGLADDAPEVAAALELRGMLEREQSIKADLVAAAQARDQAQLEAALKAAEDAHIPPAAEEVNDARNVLNRILAENEARTALSAAVSANSLEDLKNALREAGRLGLSGAEVDAARDVSQKLGAQSELRTRLATLASDSEDLDALEQALREAEGMQVMDSPEAQDAQAKRDRLREERALIAEVEASMSSNNLQDLTRAIAQCTSMGITAKYASVLDSAKSQQSSMSEQLKAQMALQGAVKNRDLDAILSALNRAREVGVDAAEIQEAEKARDELNNEQGLLTELSEAISAKDRAQIETLLERATALNLGGDTVQEARVILDRELEIQRTLDRLAAATENSDLQGLNDAIETAIQLGLESEQVDSAKTLRDGLAVIEDAKAEVVAAYRTLEVKSHSKAGIVATDLEAIADALEKARAAGVADDVEQMAQAIELQEHMKAQLDVQERLESAVESENLRQLKDALDAAEDLNLKLDSLSRVKTMLKELEAERRAGGEPEELNEEDFDRMERDRKERQQRARQERYRFDNYGGLRSADDFAKGVILNKKRVKETMLRHQATQITKSLLDVNKDTNKLAIQIHKDLLGYMGDKTMSFPATLAQDILQKGSEYPDLRDEIYIQLLKQLTGNPRPESIAKGWQVMCMCVSTFPPTIDFENYLLNFILEKRDSKGAVRNYAKYCLRTLEGMLSSGESSGFVPSVEEIQAYKERPPILATIELVDGQVLTEDLPVTPDLNVGKVLEICTGWLQLTDPRGSTMGVFVYDVETEGEEGSGGPDPYANAPYSDLPRTPRPLRSDDFMGDVIVQKARQRRAFKFVLKKKIFLDEHKHQRSEDPMYSRLIYLQAEDEVITQGNIPIEEEDTVASLAAISLAVAFAEDFPDSVDGLVENDLLEFIPVDWRVRHTVEEWGELVLAKREELVQCDPEDLQWQFVQHVEDNPLYGTHFFYVNKVNNSPEIVAALPTELIIAFNTAGMHIFDVERTQLESFGYADVYRWGGSSSQFSLIVWDQNQEDTFELIVTTAQASDMAAIILDHIKAIMTSTKTEEG